MSSLSRATGALQRLAGVQVRSRWGQVHPPAPERSLPYLALSRELRVTHHPGVPAPRLPAVLGQSSGSRSLPRHAGSGRQLHRVPFYQDRYGPAGPTEKEGLLKAHLGGSARERVHLPLHATRSGPWWAGKGWSAKPWPLLAALALQERSGFHPRLPSPQRHAQVCKEDWKAMYLYRPRRRILVMVPSVLFSNRQSTCHLCFCSPQMMAMLPLKGACPGVNWKLVKWEMSGQWRVSWHYLSLGISKVWGCM